MFFINAVVVTFSLLCFCDSAYVDTLTRCSIKDSVCLKGLYHKVLQDAQNGIPELDILPLDPLHLQDVAVNVLDTLVLTITDGVAKGMSKCVFNKFSIDIENHKGSLDATCDVLTVETHFNVAGESPLIQAIIGGLNVNGEGKAKIKLDNVNLIVDYEMYPQKINDTIYMYISNKDLKYSYDIGNAHATTENIIIGKSDVSDLVSLYFNANWKQLVQSYGSLFIGKTFEIFISRIQKFCDGVEANKYISDDLSSYVKK